MTERQHSWEKHLYRPRERGWAQSRNEPPIVGLDPPETVEYFVAPQASSPEEDSLDRVFNTVQTYACADEDSRDYRNEDGDRSIYNPTRGPDVLDFIFDSLEEFACSSDKTTRALQDAEPYWDHNQFDNADRGYITGEVWSLRKLGENEKRSSVADRIKAFEANGSPTNPSRTKVVVRPTKKHDGNAKSRSVAPIWKKPIEKVPESRSDVGQISRTKETESSRSEVVVPSYPKPPTQPSNGTSASKFQKKQPIPWPQTLKYAQRKAAHPNAVVAKIVKDSPNESSGLSFVSYYEKQGIYISKIRDGSKFKDTELEQGMKVLRINDSPCPMRVKHVIKMIKSANSEVKIEAMKDDTIAFIHNEKPTPKNGSPVEPLASEKEKVETSLDEEVPRDGPPSESNGEEATMDLADRLFLSMGYVRHEEGAPAGTQIEEPIERKESSVSIVSLDRSEIPVKPKNKKVHATIFKKTTRDKIGISFVSFKKKRGVYVYEMYEDSKFQGTGLEVGMKVLAINGEPCSERVSETLKKVKAIDGELVVTAVTPSEEDTTTRQRSGRPEKVNEQEAPDRSQSLRKLGNGRRRKFTHNGGSDGVTGYPSKRDHFGTVNNKVGDVAYQGATATGDEICDARRAIFRDDADASSAAEAREGNGGLSQIGSEESSKSWDEDGPSFYGWLGL